MRTWHKRAFTLVELLVVLFIMSVLMGILMPALSRARLQARSVVCHSNIHQLYLANLGYATENDNFYVRAAPDMSSGFGGRCRWHGVREATAVDPDPAKNTFDPLKGPLSSYLADGKVKQCPQIVHFVTKGSLNAFEAGCGGYGYNSVGVGSRSYRCSADEDPMKSSMKIMEIKRPREKVMFTDTAFFESYPYRYVIEYSFCEPPKFVFFDGVKIVESGKPVPSIHFRHLGKTNVIWCDGHTSSEEFAFSKFEQDVLKDFNIGWFGPKDNTLFRP